MKDIFEINVDEKLYEKILNNKCRYYMFINDRIRMQYKVGNVLTFKAGEKSLKVSIKNLLYFSSIKELLEMIGKEKFGFTPSQNSDKIEDIYYVNYNPTDIDKFGLVAVEFEKFQ